MSYNTIDPLWNTHDTFTIPQATALIAGYDPSTVYFEMNCPSHVEDDKGFSSRASTIQIKAAFSALTNAINFGTLITPISSDRDGDRTWSNTRVHRDHLTAWLRSKDIYPAFFFPDKTCTLEDIARYKSENEALKTKIYELEQNGGFILEDKQPKELMAAMALYRRASHGLPGKKTVKQELEDLAPEFCAGLDKGAGKRIATVCNWDKSTGRKIKHSPC